MKNFGFKKGIVYATAFITIAGVFAISPLAIQEVSAASDIDANPGFAISSEIGAGSAVADNGDDADEDEGSSSDGGSVDTTNTDDDSSTSGGDEGSFTTDASSQPSSNSDFAISDEIGGGTDGGTPTNPTDEEEVGGEHTFTTDDTTPVVVDDNFVISSEFSFATDENEGGNPTDPDFVISSELSFITDGNGGGGNPTDPDLAISGEFSFVTDDTNPSTGDPDFAISSEQTFTTNGGGGGGGDDNGGGGGGGCWRCNDSDPEPEGEQCEPYLKEFIRLGSDNNPVEVLKLKSFLNEYEGFDLELTPIYDIEAYNAVQTFQLRYADDVLNPWDIDGPTGYVFVTTTIKINRIICDDPRPTTFKLSIPELIQEVPAAEDLGDFDLFDPNISDLLGQFPLEPVEGEDDNTGFLAALGFFNFEGLCEWCWLIIIILLLILGYSIYRNRELKKEVEDLEDDIDMFGGMSGDDVSDLDEELNWDGRYNEDVIPNDFDESDFEFEPTEPEDMETLVEDARNRINLDGGKSSEDIQMMEEEVEAFEEATKSHVYNDKKITHAFSLGFLPWIESFLCEWCWLIILLLIVAILGVIYKNYELRKRREELYDTLDEIDGEVDDPNDFDFFDEGEEGEGPSLDELISEIRREREENEK